MKTGKRYLLAKWDSKHYEEVKCLEVSKTSYKLQWLSGAITWEQKEIFKERASYSFEYSIIEELS